MILKIIATDNYYTFKKTLEKNQAYFDQNLRF